MPTSAESTQTSADRVAALAALGKQLLTQQTELEAAMSQRLDEHEEVRSDVTDGPGETEHLVVAEQNETNARIDAISRVALADVESAIARIEAGTYGRCVSCNDEIPLERLEIRPSAPVCVRCQAEYEGD